MNKDRKKRLSKIWSLLEEIKDEEQEAFDNLPESMQYTEKGESMEQNIDEIDEVMERLNEITNS